MTTSKEIEVKFHGPSEQGGAMQVLVTGSSGLIGSETVRFFCELGFDVTGIDNNQRRAFFGAEGDTQAVLGGLETQCPGYRHVPLDIRDRDGVESLIAGASFDLVIHAAAQPSHDYSAKAPLEDFDVNAGGTLNMLEACRLHAPDAVFCHLSTNKVYGDGVNQLELVELDTRYEFADAQFAQGIDESFPIDHCLHSPFGASKAAADLMAQEYGRYFGLKTGIFRCGCLTGPSHAGVELHGFLSYLVKTALAQDEYTIFGYHGKQVRDQMHAHDVVSALWAFAQKPTPGAVYNLGGGKANSASVLECIELIADTTGKRPVVRYDKTNRVGDHICYYSDMTKFRRDYPDWSPRYDLAPIVAEMVESCLPAETAIA